MTDSRARCSVFIATSVDGFIAREDGTIDWLQRANAVVPPGEDCGYSAFMGSIGAIVIGRRTFETVCAFADWPYGETPVVVMSRQPLTLPSTLPASVSASDDTPASVVRRLSEGGAARLYVDGGELIQSFLRDDLVDDLTITVIPTLLGAGRRLFGPLPRELDLQHVATRSWEFGFVQHEYRVARPGAAAGTGVPAAAD
jgi:dihydrofolate reductase